MRNLELHHMFPEHRHEHASQRTLLVADTFSRASGMHVQVARKWGAGFVMVDALAAIAVLAFVMVAVLTMLSHSSDALADVYLDTQARYLLQDTVEHMFGIAHYNIVTGKNPWKGLGAGIICTSSNPCGFGTTSTTNLQSAELRHCNEVSFTDASALGENSGCRLLYMDDVAGYPNIFTGDNEPRRFIFNSYYGRKTPFYRFVVNDELYPHFNDGDGSSVPDARRYTVTIEWMGTHGTSSLSHTFTLYATL